jgi:hypothetical protein
MHTRVTTWPNWPTIRFNGACWMSELRWNTLAPSKRLLSEQEQESCIKKSASILLSAIRKKLTISFQHSNCEFILLNFRASDHYNIGLYTSTAHCMVADWLRHSSTRPKNNTFIFLSNGRIVFAWCRIVSSRAQIKLESELWYML